MDRKRALEVLARDFSASSTECEADEYMTLAEAFDEYGLESMKMTLMTPLMVLLTVCVL